MLIGSCFIMLLRWRLPRQSADWLAMTCFFASACLVGTMPTSARQGRTRETGRCGHRPLRSVKSVFLSFRGSAATVGISSTEASYMGDPINMEYLGFSMLIGSHFVVLLRWRLHHRHSLRSPRPFGPRNDMFFCFCVPHPTSAPIPVIFLFISYIYRKNGIFMLG